MKAFIFKSNTLPKVIVNGVPYWITLSEEEFALLSSMFTKYGLSAITLKGENIYGLVVSHWPGTYSSSVIKKEFNTNDFDPDWDTNPCAGLNIDVLINEAKKIEEAAAEQIRVEREKQLEERKRTERKELGNRYSMYQRLRNYFESEEGKKVLEEIKPYDVYAATAHPELSS